jgi:SNF2 family DNA or RNA helicase
LFCQSDNELSTLYQSSSCHAPLSHPSPYSELKAFKELIKDKISSNAVDGYKLLQAVLQPMLLRRTKTSKLHGEPIVNLPPREQELVQQDFSKVSVAMGMG